MPFWKQVEVTNQTNKQNNKENTTKKEQKEHSKTQSQPNPMIPVCRQEMFSSCLCHHQRDP